MKFTIPAGDLLDGLKSVQARAKANSTELLKHIRFDVVGPKLTLLGHDSASSSEAYLAVDGAQDGACAVPADSIVQLVGLLPKAAHIDVERSDFRITIKSGRSRYKLPILGADDFPGPLPCENPVTIDLDAKAITQLFDRPRAALDPRETRQFGQGVYLHSADGAICSAATDGKHFTRYSSELSMPELVGVIVPTAALGEIVRLGPGKLSVSERTVALETADRRFCTKLIDAQYIDYNRGIPGLIKNYVEVDREELLGCFNRLASIANADSQLHLVIKDGEIVLSLTGSGDGVETIRCSGDALPDSFVAALPGQFIDTMKMLNGDVIQLHIGPRATSFRIVDPFEPTAILAQSTQIPRLRAAA